MKTFDLLICDMTTPIPYEQQTLQVQGLGGTEASVIRIAEGLAALGATVGVMQHNLDKVLMGENAYYLPLKMLDEVKTHNYVALRGTQFLSKFPKAKKFSWHEDVPNQQFGEMRDDFINYNTTVIAASDWHKQECQRWVCDIDKQDNPRVVRIYNPVEDIIFIPKNIEVQYDRNKLVWPASPHKGLKEAIELVKRLIEVSGNKDFKLYTFNPGYMSGDLTPEKFIMDYGPVPCAELWQHISESLCVFYPTEFEETFGCIAAEANALHTPVLTHEVAALAETVSSSRQFVAKKDTQKLLDTVMKWHAGDRPKVWGQDRLRLTEVLKDWVKLLSGSVYL